MPSKGISKLVSAGAVLAIVVVIGVGVAGTLGGNWWGTGKAGKTSGVEASKGKPRLARIDVHTHINPDGLERALAIMDLYGIDGMVNLSGYSVGPPQHLLERQVAMAKSSGGRIAVFANVNFMKALRQAHYGVRSDYGVALAEELSLAKEVGAIGLKIPKGLGLGYPHPHEPRPLPVDDVGLDPLFEKAGELHMPISIHTGDPKAFWLPADEKNERWDELQAHPEWAFGGDKVPSWQALYDAFERRVARHPKTTFIGVHFGNNPEDPERVGQMLDKYPNLFIDTAARVPEIGRKDATKMRMFFEKYQDRVLFGTDVGIGATQDEMMYGSNGANPPNMDDERRYFASTWRYFESKDKQFESPTPIQGRWKIDGLGLSESVLRKLYFQNAARILKWKPEARPVPPVFRAPQRDASAMPK